jgi:recombination protein RecR
MIPSKLLENAVHELSRLPGIGKKTAMRLALHLLRERESDVVNLSDALVKMRQEIRYCTMCHNISDNETCHICTDPRRNAAVVCVVQDIRDVLAIENTRQYTGRYHVLGGIISPIEGISPSDLSIEHLVTNVETNSVQEVIMALPSSIEGETTSFYIYKRIKSLPITISTIARGVAIGDELEYTDEITLGRSILQRMPYTGS